MKLKFATALALAASLAVLGSHAHALTLLKRTAAPMDFNKLIGDGRWTVVMLWATDCVPCEVQKPDVDAFHVNHVDKDARVVGVALDGVDQLRAINKAMRLTPTRFPNYVSNYEQMTKDIRAITGEEYDGLTPTYILFDPTGKYVKANFGPIEMSAIEAVIDR